MVCVPNVLSIENHKLISLFSLILHSWILKNDASIMYLLADINGYHIKVHAVYFSKNKKI